MKVRSVHEPLRNVLGGSLAEHPVEVRPLWAEVDRSLGANPHLQ